MQARPGTANGKCLPMHLWLKTTPFLVRGSYFAHVRHAVVVSAYSSMIHLFATWQTQKRCTGPCESSKSILGPQQEPQIGSQKKTTYIRTAAVPSKQLIFQEPAEHNKICLQLLHHHQSKTETSSSLRRISKLERQVGRRTSLFAFLFHLFPWIKPISGRLQKHPNVNPCTSGSSSHRPLDLSATPAVLPIVSTTCPPSQSVRGTLSWSEERMGSRMGCLETVNRCEHRNINQPGDQPKLSSNMDTSPHRGQV